MNRPMLLAGAALALSGIALAGIAAAPLAAQSSAGTPQVSQGTANLGPQSPQDPASLLGDLWMTHTPGATEVISADHNSAAASEFGKALIEGNGAEAQLRRRLAQLASDPRMSPGLRKEGLDAAKDLKTTIANNEKWGGRFETLGKLLEVIDITSTLAKAAGYAAERDATGAANVLFKELSKKLLEGIGMAGLSWIPGGQVLGTVAGEQIYEGYVEKELEKRENEVRAAEYAEKYLNKPWLPVNQVMDDRGNVRTIDADMYIDKETGQIKRRTPEQQALYEEGMKTRWLDGNRWAGVMRDLAEGKIDQARYDELRENYANRDPSRPWNPDAADPLGAGRFAGSYVGRFSGGGAGTIRFTISGTSVSGSLSGVCTKNPCINDAVSGTFNGSVSDLGMIRTSLNGAIDSSTGFKGHFPFSGSLDGVVDRTGGAGQWVGHNKYGSPAGSWQATRSR